MAPNQPEIFKQLCEPDCFFVESLISRGRESPRNREYKHRIVSTGLRYTISFQRQECLDIENSLISFYITALWQLVILAFAILVFTSCSHKFELDLSSETSLSLGYVLMFSLGTSGCFRTIRFKLISLSVLCCAFYFQNHSESLSLNLDGMFFQCYKVSPCRLRKPLCM